ncbi:MAG: chromate efflux transporter, partial [Elusimicrobia bacterium]|nr:chromate efflux transporter [Elusimicrobiota bacterium]
MTTDAPQARGSLRGLVLYFLKLGAVCFGGPIALIGAMERDLVEERGWISAEDFRLSLALAQLAPGPLAAQTAIGLGYVRGGIWGATLVAVAFILPSFLMVVAIGWAYVRFGGLRWMQALFYGVGAAVIGIIIRSAWKLTTSTIGPRRLLWLIYAAMAAFTAVTRREIGTLFLLSGVLALFVYAPPRAWAGRLQAAVPWIGLLAPQGMAPASGETLWKIFFFFSKAGAFVFGSGLAIVPFLYGGVVQDYRWLTESQFLDAVAVAMITPGPVVITVAFIGYLVAGLAGACLAALGVFLPVYLFVVIPFPWFKRHGGNPQLKAFVDGVTAAAVGAITGAVFTLGA